MLRIFLRNIKADMVFFSLQGLSVNGDIPDSFSVEVSIRRAKLASANEKNSSATALKEVRNIRISFAI